MDVLHGDEVALVDLPEVEDLHDVRVGEAGHHLGLVHEHVHELLVVGEVGQDALDRQGLLEARDAAALGLEHLGHAPDRDPVEELVGAEDVVAPARALARPGRRGRWPPRPRRPGRAHRSASVALRAGAPGTWCRCGRPPPAGPRPPPRRGRGRRTPAPPAPADLAVPGARSGVLPPMGSNSSRSASTSLGRPPSGARPVTRRGGRLADADPDRSGLAAWARPLAGGPPERPRGRRRGRRRSGGRSDFARAGVGRVRRRRLARHGPSIGGCREGRSRTRLNSLRIGQRRRRGQRALLSAPPASGRAAIIRHARGTPRWTSSSTTLWSPGASGSWCSAVVYQKVAPRLRIRVPGRGLSAAGSSDTLLGPRFREAKKEREVVALTKQGDFLAAGKLLEDMGRTQEAAEAYLEGQEYWAAAATFERLGRGEHAAELYLQAGDYKKAAQLFVNAGKPAQGGRALRGEGQQPRGGAPLRRWPASGTRPPTSTRRAAIRCARPRPSRRGRVRRRPRRPTRSTSWRTSPSPPPTPPTAPSADQKSALLAGRLFEKAGQLDRAFQVYNKGGYFKEAAAVLEKLGQFKKAGELYMRAEDSESAARAFEQGGRRRATPPSCAARWPSRPTGAAEAAAYFVQGHDFLRAAELFESVGQLAEAAAAFEAGESWAAAGGVYVRAGLKDRAAAAYEKGGEFETAAKLYEEAGNEAKAAELYGRAGPDLQERRGRGAGGRARQGDRPPAARGARRRELPRRPPSSWPGSSSSRGMPALALERVQKVDRRAAGGADQPRPLLLARAGPRGLRPGQGGPRDLREDPLRGPELPRRGQAGRAPARLPAGREPRLADCRRSPPAAPAPVAARGGASRRACRTALPPPSGAPAPAAAARPALRASRGDRPRAAGRRLPRRGPGRRPQRRPARSAPRALPGDGVLPAVGGRPEGRLPALAPEPREGPRPRRDLRPALPRHRARVGQELRARP